MILKVELEKCFHRGVFMSKEDVEIYNIIVEHKAIELLQKATGDGYWGNHPIHLVEDWKLQVSNSETRQSYWEWVLSNIKQAETDKENSEQINLNLGD